MAIGQLAGSSALTLPLALAVYGPSGLPIPSAAALGAVAGIALLSTAAAYILFFRLLSRAGATNASLVTLLTPVTALLLGALLLNEAVTWRAVAGMGLIAAGFAVIDGRLARMMRGGGALPGKRGGRWLRQHGQ